jgi:Protein of unknown function (DUF2934)
MSGNDPEESKRRVSEYEIRLRAYEVICARMAQGRPGSELEDWLHAEAELTFLYPCEN